LHALYQAVGQHADRIRGLPARRVIARGFREPEPETCRRLPFEPVRGELLARRSLQRGAERDRVEPQRLDSHAQRETEQRRRGLRQQQRPLVSGPKCQRLRNWIDQRASRPVAAR
jgi:hypothetical protein